MSIIFYDHLVVKTEITDFIDSLEDNDSQKGKAKQLVDDIIHQAVVEFVLDKLPKTKQTIFLEQLHERPYDPEIISYLKDHVHPEIEADIAKHLESIIEDIKRDLSINLKK